MTIPEAFELGQVPFYWRVKATPEAPPNHVPASLHFAFTFLEEHQLVIQKRNPQTLEWLDAVYREDANVGYLQDGHALAASYGGEFIDFFSRACELLGPIDRTAADIGCGGVYLLQKVRERGFSVKGIDPSPVTAAAGVRAGIEIVSDFYPTEKLNDRFGVLFHYDVLEHVEDPVAFLRAHHGNLAPGGAIVFAVPDCSHHIELGDVSMVLHEHLNYFDQQSLRNVVTAAGFTPLLLEAAQHGGVLLCCAIPSETHLPVHAGTQKFSSFCSRARAAITRFNALLSQGGSTGLYVPLRAFPYLGELNQAGNLRFFDDDPGLYGRYYDGFDHPVENRADLVANPPDRVIICSLAFGERIADRIRAENCDAQLILWSSLFEDVR